MQEGKNQNSVMILLFYDHVCCLRQVPKQLYSVIMNGAQKEINEEKGRYEKRKFCFPFSSEEWKYRIN